MSDFYHRKYSESTRLTYFGVAASFLFFLLYSAPHRVHHFFEQIEATNHEGAHDHHGESKRQNTSSNGSDCVFQASTNRCAIGLTAQTPQPTLTLLVQSFVDFLEETHPHQFLGAAFQIRAPPSA